ncbi:hypothetical protein [Actinospica sp.]|uniref:hypothetical protein n=1 Tax=Actinospica sp. TaxID=1872142 RepID=UPI002BD71F24|nr:hypothetical protein [Actinospica sp.]HWG22981.1 hypothetical protein [Actinospica sp.]
MYLDGKAVRPVTLMVCVEVSGALPPMSSRTRLPTSSGHFLVQTWQTSLPPEKMPNTSL